MTKHPDELVRAVFKSLAIEEQSLEDIFNRIQMAGLAIAAIDAVRKWDAEHAWQPIETAPRDGTCILAECLSLEFVAIISWEDGFGWCDRLTDSDPWPAEFWMPLPPPPETGHEE